MKLDEARKIAEELVGVNNRSKGETAAVVLYQELREYDDIKPAILTAVEHGERRGLLRAAEIVRAYSVPSGGGATSSPHIQEPLAKTLEGLAGVAPKP